MTKRLRSPNGLLFTYGPGIQMDGDCVETIGCGHCQTTIISSTETDNQWGICYQCWRMVCASCYKKGNCVPWEEMLDKIEHRDRARRSMGL